jgi:hypothetical protein
MFNDFDYPEFNDQFDNDDLLPFEENTKAFKAAKKDLAKVMPKPEEQEEVEDNDDYVGDWITITEDDGEDD